jgi:hypothetical protein
MRSRPSFWTTRDAALHELKTVLSAEACAIDEIFKIVDQILHDFEAVFMSDSDFVRVAALLGVKGRNLAFACYSLALDGLAQESGALLRPMLEAIELLKYIRITPKGVTQAIDGKLPPAGHRAKVVAGTFRELRDHLNKNACHVGFSYASMQHMVDLTHGRLRIVQPHRTGVLKQNMGSIYLFTSMLAVELVECFAYCSVNAKKVPVMTESCLNRIHESRSRARKLFFPNLMRGGQ